MHISLFLVCIIKQLQLLWEKERIISYGPVRILYPKYYVLFGYFIRCMN
jgi:hypothetical protein